MHYHMEVWLKDSKDFKKQIENILAPFDENLQVEKQVDNDGDVYFNNPKGFWDWYEIGGRWTGAHTDYDPYKDPANYEDCWLCHGTGFRNDALGISARRKNASYTCNGCGEYDFENKVWKHGTIGIGKKIKFSLNPYSGDIIPVSSINEKLSCATMIVGDTVLRDEIWDGEHWVETGFNGKVKENLEKLGISDGFVVTVDYHS